MKHFILLLFPFLFIPSVLQAQEKAPIEWKNIQRADSLQLSGDQRPLFVDVYADWCGPCKYMDKVTFHDDEVAKYVNENFIPVKFNAETNEKIIFKGNIYSWVSTGTDTGIQSLAYFMLGGRMSYPSIAIVNKDGQTLTVIVGFIQPGEFLPILKEVKKQFDELKTSGKL